MNMQKIRKYFVLRGQNFGQVILTKRGILYLQNQHTGVFSWSFQATYLKKLPYNPPPKVLGSLRA
jgi:hypothetical protein